MSSKLVFYIFIIIIFIQGCTLSSSPRFDFYDKDVENNGPPDPCKGTIPIFVASRENKPELRYGQDRELTFQNFRTFFAKALASEFKNIGYYTPVTDLGTKELEELTDPVKLKSQFGNNTCLILYIENIVVSKWYMYSNWVSYKGQLNLWREGDLALRTNVDIDVYSKQSHSDFVRTLRVNIRYELPFWYKWDKKF